MFTCFGVLLPGYFVALLFVEIIFGFPNFFITAPIQIDIFQSVANLAPFRYVSIQE